MLKLRKTSKIVLTKEKYYIMWPYNEHATWIMDKVMLIVSQVRFIIWVMLTVDLRAIVNKPY